MVLTASGFCKSVVSLHESSMKDGQHVFSLMKSKVKYADVEKRPLDGTLKLSKSLPMCGLLRGVWLQTGIQ
jgi:hypothetical protein